VTSPSRVPPVLHRVRAGSARVQPRVLLGLAVALLVGHPATAAPTIDRVAPGGGRRGSEIEIVLSGRSLASPQEVFFEEPGISILEVAGIDGNRVRARLAIAADCRPGNHRLRLRTADGLSDLRMFRVGILEQVTEQEPNGDAVTAGVLPLTAEGLTVAGVIGAGDLDVFRVRAGAGARIAVAVDGVRLDQEMFDPHVEIVAADGTVIADRDDHPLLAQDTMLAVTAPADGDYFIRLRESAYGGSDGCVYLLHVGGFPVPHVAWPPGGTPGSELDVTWLGDPDGSFTTRVRVPAAGDAAGLADVLPARGGLVGPVPVPLRVSPLPVVTEAEPDDAPEQATRASAPAAFVGVLGVPGDVDWLRVEAPAGSAWHVRAFGRRLGSPVDLVVAAHQDDAKRGRITSNDDGDSPDSVLRLTTPETGSFLLRVSDHQRRGGADFVWWLEVAPVLPDVHVSVPPGRNNTQDRLVGSVPRGNRTALVLNAARSDFAGGDIDLLCHDLPPGVQATVPPLAGSAPGTLVVLEAPSDAPEATGLARFDCLARESGGGVAAGARLGGLRQTTALVFGLPNNTVYRTSVSDRLPVAVVGPAPLRVEVEPPPVPLVRGGSLDLIVHVDRDAGTTGKVRLGFPFKPPGITAQTDVDVAEGATTGSFTVNAKTDAPLREWPVVITGLIRSRDDGGPIVSSRPVGIRVVEPMVEMTVARVVAEVGTETKLVGTLSKPSAFTGTARVKVLGLPAGVEAPEVELSADAREVVIPIMIGPKAPPGKHDNILCQVQVPLDGHWVIHRMPATQLRIDRPLAGRGKSPPDVFPRMKTSGFQGRYASAIASLRSSRLFVNSLLETAALPERAP
jgi:hypothetical protein